MKPNNFPLRTVLDGSEELYSQTSGVSEKFTLEQAKEYIRPYKVYTALLTQDTSAPIATVLENTLGEDVVWSRNKAGSYKASSIIDFELLNTFILCGAVKISNAVIVTTIDPINKDITLQTHSSGLLSDNILYYTSFEIRVYN
jgi:hypothetical protein